MKAIEKQAMKQGFGWRCIACDTWCENPWDTCSHCGGFGGIELDQALDEEQQGWATQPMHILPRKEVAA